MTCSRTLMQAALAEARKCTPVPTAFCVGCVLAYKLESDSEPTIVATGYSRELPGNTHAEANALQKLSELTPARIAALFPHSASPQLLDILEGVDVYTTMEPCSIRTSGLAPCADALIRAKVRRVFIGTGEPDDFVKCEGGQKLQDAGIELVWVDEFKDECLSVARRTA